MSDSSPTLSYKDLPYPANEESVIKTTSQQLAPIQYDSNQPWEVLTQGPGTYLIEVSLGQCHNGSDGDAVSVGIQTTPKGGTYSGGKVCQAYKGSSKDLKPLVVRAVFTIETNDSVVYTIQPVWAVSKDTGELQLWDTIDGETVEFSNLLTVLYFPSTT